MWKSSSAGELSKIHEKVAGNTDCNITSRPIPIVSRMPIPDTKSGGDLKNRPPESGLQDFFEKEQNVESRPVGCNTHLQYFEGAVISCHPDVDILAVGYGFRPINGDLLPILAARIEQVLQPVGTLSNCLVGPLDNEFDPTLRQTSSVQKPHLSIRRAPS